MIRSSSSGCYISASLQLKIQLSFHGQLAFSEFLSHRVSMATSRLLLTFVIVLLLALLYLESLLLHLQLCLQLSQLLRQCLLHPHYSTTVWWHTSTLYGLLPNCALGHLILVFCFVSHTLLQWACPTLGPSLWIQATTLCDAAIKPFFLGLDEAATLEAFSIPWLSFDEW